MVSKLGGSEVNPVTQKLDGIAETLEKKGLMKEASDVDVVSNTIEAMMAKENEEDEEEKKE